jgi:hypothetical protein
MKHILLVLLTAFTFTQSKAQAPNPDCTNLLVDSVYVLGSDLRVVLSNTCSTCASGINGAIYLEMAVVRRSDPTDTFSSTDCYCQMTPYNNSSLAYTMPAPVLPLPALSDIRVVLNSLCFDIPFRTVTGINGIEDRAPVISFESTGRNLILKGAADANYRLRDNTGRVVSKGDISENRFQLSAQFLPSGLYYVELVKDSRRSVKKIIIH